MCVGRQEALRAEWAETTDRHEATRAEGVARGRSGKHEKRREHRKAPAIYKSIYFCPLFRSLGDRKRSKIKYLEG